MPIWTITLTRGKAAIVIEGEGEDPHIPDHIGFDIRGSPGPIYQELRERIARGPWSWLQDRMRDEDDLYWIDHAARETALQYPGWTVESNLPPLEEPEDIPGRCDRMSEKKPDHADKFTWTEDEIEVVGHEPVTDEDRRRVLREHDRR